jgi:hypothetical protein
MSRGYLYIIAGQELYFKEALESIRSLKAVTPDAHVTMYSDTAFEDPEGLIDHFEIREMDTSERMYDGKVHHIADSPYDRTIFMDSDTYVLEPMEPLFGLLDTHDLAMVQAPGPKCGTRREDGSLIEGHNLYNCGMMVFKKSEPTLNLFQRWNELFDKQVPNQGFMIGYNQRREQPAFALAAYESDASIYTLNHCWNIRVRGPAHLLGTPKMLHARLSQPDRDLVIELLRKRSHPRVWNWERFKTAKKERKL